MASVRIGIDFDNTIVSYDTVFSEAARHMGLVPAGFEGSKRDVRRAVRRLEDGERKWMALQGQVYGAYMPRARMFPMVAEFLTLCRERGDVTVFIISHKTEFGHYDSRQVDLRQASRVWMADHRFFDGDGFAIAEENVTFHETRQKKVARIAEVGCSHFIDDLEDVLAHPDFPRQTRRFHFIPEPDGKEHLPNVVACSSWDQLIGLLLEDEDRDGRTSR